MTLFLNANNGSIFWCKQDYIQLTIFSIWFLININSVFLGVSSKNSDATYWNHIILPCHISISDWFITDIFYYCIVLLCCYIIIFTNCCYCWVQRRILSNVVAFFCWLVVLIEPRNKCHHCVRIIVIQHSTNFKLPNTQEPLFQWYVIKKGYHIVTLVINLYSISDLS